MSKRFLLTSIPHKFWWIIARAIENQIAHENALRNDDDTPDEVLAEFDYGNDTAILEMMLDKFNNKNQWVDGSLYALSQNADDTQSTLQLFGREAPQGETVKWVFLAKDFDEACAIKNRLMDFEPYKPMPTNIAIDEHYVLVKNEEQYGLTVCIYQPQNFDGIWQCDYHIFCDLPEFSSIYQTVSHKNGLSVLKSAVKSVENELGEFRRLGFKVMENQMIANHHSTH